MKGVTQLLAAARRGEAGAVDGLYALLYHDLRHLARARLRPHQRGTLLDTTALVHESFLRFTKAGALALTDRAHFMGYAGRVMRSVIVDFVRTKRTLRRGGDEIHVTLNTDVAAWAQASEDDVIYLNDALDELAKIDARLVQVIELRYFAGLDDMEVAHALGISDRTVRRDWEKARLLLHAALR